MQDLPDIIPLGQEPWSQAPDTLPADFNFDKSHATLAHSQGAIDNLRRQAQEAQVSAQAAQSPLGIAKETAKGTVSQLATGPIRALRSGIDFLGEKLTGVKPQGEFTGFTGEPVKTYQAELESGEAPLGVAGQAALDVASILPVGKGISGAKTAFPKVAGAISKLASPIIKPITSYLAQRAEKKSVGVALKAVTPKTKDLTSTEYENLLSRKRITPKSGLKAPEYILSEREKTAATKYKDILQDKDPVKNTISVRNQIAKEDADVGSFLEKNNSIFNSGELRNYISKEMEDVSDVMVPEERIAKLKDQITSNFLSSLKKNDMKSLWEGRKEFDQAIEKAFSGSPTLIKEVKKKFRNAVQEYISEKTPDGIYKAKMKDMTDLFNLEDVIQTKATKEKGLTGLQAWAKEHPLEAAVVGAGVTTAGGGILWNVAQ